MLLIFQKPKQVIMFLFILLISSVVILSFFVGTQITEAILFVPYWKKMQPQKFFELHKVYGQKIYSFYAPITILATLIPLTTAIYSWIEPNSIRVYTSLMGVFTLIFFMTYSLYFKKANQSFAEASLTEAELPAELERWDKWHWSRVVLEFLALGFAVFALFLI